MRILFVADGRSPITLNWISYFLQHGHEVHLASTFACSPDLPLASLTLIPVAFSSARGVETAGGSRQRKGILWGAALVGIRTTVRQWLGPLTLPAAAQRLSKLARRIQPDVIHAMRIPYEGMLVGWAFRREAGIPWVVSVWGNDFTLHAPANPWMRRLTRMTLQHASALHTDCQRDRRLAFNWGFDPSRPSIVLPGGGGVQLDLFSPPADPERQGDLVLQPRGIRAYVRNDTFFQGIPLVLEKKPAARFLCTGMAGDPQALRWQAQAGGEEIVKLLPRQTRLQMAGLFQAAKVAVSLTTHDGTPNTLLEAMACGCFPVAGDLESIREWITHGENGFLVDPSDPQAFSEAVLRALSDEALRVRAAAMNRQMIRERAEYSQVMAAAGEFYKRLAE